MRRYSRDTIAYLESVDRLCRDRSNFTRRMIVFQRVHKALSACPRCLLPQCQAVSELAEPDALDRTLNTVPKALPAHSILGPFTFNVLTIGLQGRPQFTTTAIVQFAHTAAPRFRGAAQSDEIRVQVANR